MTSSVFYSNEPGITSDIRSVESAYGGSIKHMLSVRTSTCDLVFIEAGLPNAKSWGADRQYKFLKQLRSLHVNDYIILIHHWPSDSKTHTYGK